MPEPNTEAAFLEALFAHSPVGLYILDPDLRIVRYNRAARGVRGIPAEDVLGRAVTDFVLGPDVRQITGLAERVLRTGEALRNHLFRGRSVVDPAHEAALSVSLFRLDGPGGRTLGLAALVEDVTERERALARMDVVADGHRRIGTTLEATTTAKELAEVAVPAFADGIVVDLYTETVQGRRMQPGRLGPGAVLRRVAQLDTEGEAVLAFTEPGTLIGLAPHTPFTQTLADLQPRLVSHLGTDAPWFAADPERARRLTALGIHSFIATPLANHDEVLGLAVFYRHRRPDPFDTEDLHLAEALASRTALNLDKAHAYQRERTLATTLQRRLLPARPPRLSAVETTYLHLQGDDNADWFDVIPLSGARVALTVGTVEGRGIEAAAAMGQLRTAVQTLAAHDPSPTELLDALADAAERLAADAAARPADRLPDGGDARTDPLSATCLYLVYDPLTRRCHAASAGHPAPVLTDPDGESIHLRLRPGPALGTGGGGFETATAELPDGSLIGLHSLGLVRARDRSAADGRDLLHQVLAHTDRTLTQLCDDTAYTLQPEPSDDDASLLLARTRVLPADRVVTWDLADDPATVSHARRLARRQLADWGLDELAETTELIVSELVTNAVRYGAEPLTLRMIHDRELICEVSDDSSTSAHMRLADDTDEGGRGLFLVMHLSHRWGTRFRSRGKTIWSTQPLPTG